jgi:uncharacterized protein (DUF3084 family)|tara:strand:+ start:588 stop:1016 length:429 start_codon:yes stop_codon:yes gene_type:complete
MTQLNDTSTVHEVQCQVQENHLGELLGRVIDLETKLNMAVFQNQKLGSMFAEYEDARKKVEEWKTKYDALKSNADAFEVGMDEARAELKKVKTERQAAQEEALTLREELTALRKELAALKNPKPKSKTRKVANGKYNPTQAQ